MLSIAALIMLIGMRSTDMHPGGRYITDIQRSLHSSTACIKCIEVFLSYNRMHQEQSGKLTPHLAMQHHCILIRHACPKAVGYAYRQPSHQPLFQGGLARSVLENQLQHNNSKPLTS